MSAATASLLLAGWLVRSTLAPGYRIQLLYQPYVCWVAGRPQQPIDGRDAALAALKAAGQGPIEIELTDSQSLAAGPSVAVADD